MSAHDTPPPTHEGQDDREWADWESSGEKPHSYLSSEMVGVFGEHPEEYLLAKPKSGLDDWIHERSERELSKKDYIKLVQSLREEKRAAQREAHEAKKIARRESHRADSTEMDAVSVGDLTSLMTVLAVGSIASILAAAYAFTQGIVSPTVLAVLGAATIFVLVFTAAAGYQIVE